MARADVAHDDLHAVATMGQRLIGFLREHSLHEDMHVLPVLAAHHADLARALAGAHAQLDALQNELGALLARAEAAAAADRISLAPRLTSLINRLVAGHVAHMDQEEREALPVLWARCSDEALRGIRACIVQSMTSARTLEWMQLVLPAINPDERAALTAAS
jgi:hypothetical protein